MFDDFMVGFMFTLAFLVVVILIGSIFGEGGIAVVILSIISGFVYAIFRTIRKKV